MPDHDFSIVGLFLAADPVVKGVMILLLAASMACWAIILEKSMALARAKAQARAFEAAVAGGGGLDTVFSGLPAAIAAAGRHEWHDFDPGESRAEQRERLERAMRTAMSEELRRLDGHLPVLATVGSSAPFVGLFGTVWGIMRSFVAIAGANDTSLAVVAPGIAEALFATAIGLVAAIPAVVAYNALTSGLGRLSQRLSVAIGRLAGQAVRSRSLPHRVAAE
ncbi:flagellar motor protein MotA [Azospirillum sp. TSH7]|uniref:MotA/TolQ/ExbB proton channel family protein n=1 Tax=unclassified Azospirillum TaxID=2630922 RepID=UPI000D604203|nr:MULTISPECIES: MotA/TolQ/ExbB proton channel family protein [unclassified Azospirillum]PWC64132.1 flagellar motor protein MotA [Azospirillum sp. TSH7]PWC69301.1 flagellar motor protein MotA [Azospirillum sp. TSH20]